MRYLSVILLVFLSWLPNFADEASNSDADPHILAKKIISSAGREGLEAKSEFVAAIPILEKGTKDFPDDSQIYLALAVCYGSQVDYPNSLKNAELAYTVGKKDKCAGGLYALILLLNKQPLKAYAVQKEMLAQYPNDYLVQITAAGFATNIQKYDEAIAILEPLNQNPPPGYEGKKNAAVPFTLGLCYLGKGDYDKAISTFEDLLNNVPEMGFASLFLGEAYLKTGHTLKAETLFDRVLAVNPNNSEALYYKGLIADKSGNYKSAKDDYLRAYSVAKQFLDKNNANGDQYYLMFLICQKLSRPDEAEKYKQQAAEMLYTYEAPWKDN